MRQLMDDGGVLRFTAQFAVYKQVVAHLNVSKIGFRC